MTKQPETQTTQISPEVHNLGNTQGYPNGGPTVEIKGNGRNMIATPKATPKRKKEKQVFWAMKGVHGFYNGTFLKRSDCIHYHLNSLGKTWTYCREKGDRCVPVFLKEVFKEPKMRLKQ